MGQGAARDGASRPDKPPSLICFSSFTLPPSPGPSCSLHSPLCSQTGWKCPQTPPQLPAVLPGCRSGNYQRTSLTTAWEIRLNPVNVFILKKRCTFNRKPWVFGWFFFSFACIFFAKRKKKDLKKKNKTTNKSILENGKRCSCVCVRSCACVCCQPTVDSLLVPNRRSLPTPPPAARWFPARGAWGGAPSPWEREATGKRPAVKQALGVLQAGRTPRAGQHSGDETGPEELPRGCDWVGDCWRRRRGALGSRLLRPPEPQRRTEDGYGGRFPPPHPILWT